MVYPATQEASQHDGDVSSFSSPRSPRHTARPKIFCKPVGCSCQNDRMVGTARYDRYKRTGATKQLYLRQKRPMQYSV